MERDPRRVSSDSRSERAVAEAFVRQALRGSLPVEPARTPSERIHPGGRTGTVRTGK